jgi:hypothetical protein
MVRLGVKASSGCVLLLLVALQMQAQKKFVIEKGEINFTSNAQLELIKASSKELKGIIDPATNQFAFRVNTRTFQGFNSSLQRDHFNENYIETEKCPTAVFSGKIIEQVDFSIDGTYDVRAKGDLDVHCQKQTRIIKSRITVKDGKLVVDAAFTVPLSDHNISIPRIVSQKIATDIEVNMSATMVQQ